MPAPSLLGARRAVAGALPRPARRPAAAALLPVPQQRRSQRSGAASTPAPPPRAGKNGGGDRGTTGNSAIDDALKVGGGLVDAAADLVPGSVPRPVAKAGVALAGAGVALWLLQKVVSTVITLAVIGAGLYFYLGRGGGEEGASSSSSGGGASSSPRRGGKGDDDDDDDDDPLAEARRIMSKYTK